MIHPPFIRMAYPECALLFELIKLLNKLKTDKHDTILEKNALKNISYSSFSSYVTLIILNTYDPICRTENCFVCRLRYNTYNICTHVDNYFVCFPEHI